MPGPVPSRHRHAIIDRFGPPSVIQVVEADLVVPGPAQVRVRVLASAVGGTDVVIRKGLYPLLREKPPLVLGFDAVGVVDCLGPDVTEPAVGSRVAVITTTGSNSDHVVVAAGEALPVPAQADPVRLAPLVMAYLTAYQMLRHHLDVRPGQRILVHGGSGAVGTAAVQLGRVMGAAVVATASPGKLDHVANQGAEPVSHADDRLWARLREASVVGGRRGFDGVLDPVGAGSVGRSMRLLAPGGIVVAYSTVAAAMRIRVRTPTSFAAFGLGYAGLRARLAVTRALPGGRRAEFYGSRDSTRDHPERHRNDLEQLCRWLAEGLIDPVVSVLPLTDLRAAHTAHDAGAVTGQVVVTTDA